jgi:hypothetical protein
VDDKGHTPGTHLDIVDVIAIPGCSEELVPKPEDKDILNHLLPKVMVNTEDLYFLPVWLQSFLEITRAFKVLSKWLLDLVIGVRQRCTKYRLQWISHNQPRDANCWITVRF